MFICETIIPFDFPVDPDVKYINAGLSKLIKFTKFLIGKDGAILDRFGSTTTPETIEAAIKEII